MVAGTCWTDAALDLWHCYITRLQFAAQPVNEIRTRMIYVYCVAVVAVVIILMNIV